MREGQDLLDGNFCFQCAAMHMGVLLAGDGKAYEMEKVNDRIVNGLRGAASTARRGIVVKEPEKREGGPWEDKKNRDARHWERKYRELVGEKLTWDKEREYYREKLKKRTAQRTKARNELSKVDRNWGALDRAKGATQQAKIKLSNITGDYVEIANKLAERDKRIVQLEHEAEFMPVQKAVHIRARVELEKKLDGMAAEVRALERRIEHFTTHDRQVVYKKAWEEEHDLNMRLEQRIKVLGG